MYKQPSSRLGTSWDSDGRADAIMWVDRGARRRSICSVEGTRTSPSLTSTRYRVSRAQDTTSTRSVSTLIGRSSPSLAASREEERRRKSASSPPPALSSSATAGGGSNTGFRGKLLNQIMEGWRNDPVFSPYYHEVGRVRPIPTLSPALLSSRELTPRALFGQVTGAHSSPAKIAKLRATYDRGMREGWGKENEWLDGPDAIREKFPQLDQADLTVSPSLVLCPSSIRQLTVFSHDMLVQGWQGLWSPNSGWVEAVDTIASIGRELVRLGVKSAFGDKGKFKRPILDESGTRCVGVETEDGTRWQADRVVLACGAVSPHTMQRGRGTRQEWVLTTFSIWCAEYVYGSGRRRWWI